MVTLKMRPVVSLLVSALPDAEDQVSEGPSEDPENGFEVL